MCYLLHVNDDLAICAYLHVICAYLHVNEYLSIYDARHKLRHIRLLDIMNIARRTAKGAWDMGKKRLGELPKTIYLVVRLEPKERAALDTLCRQHHMTRSALVRRLIMTSQNGEAHGQGS